MMRRIVSGNAVTYRTFMWQEFAARRRRNPRYSLRAFARDLAMPAPKLSQVLRGLCGISSARAEELALKLGFTDSERELFVALAETEHGRSEVSRKQARETVCSIQSTDEFSILSLDHFQIIRDWHHYAILELTEINDFNPDPWWISNRLGVKVSEIKLAIQRLLDFGLLREDSKRGYVQTHIDLATPSGVPSRSLREHHSQILQLADQALEGVSIEERDLSAITMAIDSSQLLEARRWIKKFRRRFCKDIQKHLHKDRIYCLAVQFFPLDRDRKSETIRKGDP